MHALIPDCHVDWQLVDGLNHPVDVSLRDYCGAVLFLIKNEI